MLVIVHWSICIEITIFTLLLVVNYAKKWASEDHGYFQVGL